MKRVIEGFSNEETLRFTNELADLVLSRSGRKPTPQASHFRGDDLKVTDANRQRVLAEAEALARAYAASRNKQGTSPRASVGASEDENSIKRGVLSWLERQRVRGHGKRKK